MLSAIMSVLDWIKQGAITAYWIHPSFFCCRLESGSWLEHRGYSSAPLLSSCFRTGYNSSIVLRVCTKLDVPGKAVEETVQEACESDTQTTTSDSCRPEEAAVILKLFLYSDRPYVIRPGNTSLNTVPHAAQTTASKHDHPVGSCGPGDRVDRT